MGKKLQWGDLYLDHDTGQTCKYFSPHEGQQAILNSDARFLLALSGIHGGKTALACLWLSHQIQKTNGVGQWLIVAPTYGVALSSTLEVWEKTIRGTSLQGRFVRDNANPHYLLSTSSKVYFKSGESVFDGLKPMHAILDEAGLVSEECFHAIKRRLDGTGGRLLMSTTPYLNYSWIPESFIRRADDGDKNYFYRCFPSTLNPTTDRDIIEQARKTLPVWEFDLYYNGIYTKPPGLVYDFTDADGNNCFIDAPPELPPAVAYYGGLDWGGSDPTCCLVGLLDYNDVLWVMWEKHNTEEDIIKTFEGLAEWHNAFKKASGTSIKCFWADHSPANIRGMRRFGFNCKPALKGQGSINLGIDLVRARIRSGRLKVIRSQCPNLFRESNLYRYAMHDGEPVGNKPLDKDNHALDALRYLVLGVDRKHGKDSIRDYMQSMKEANE